MQLIYKVVLVSVVYSKVINLYLCTFLLFKFFFLATPHGMWDLSSQTWLNLYPCIGSTVIATGHPRKSSYSFSNNCHYGLLQDIEYSSLCCRFAFLSSILVSWAVYPGLLKHVLSSTPFTLFRPLVNSMSLILSTLANFYSALSFVLKFYSRWCFVTESSIIPRVENISWGKNICLSTNL